MRHCLKYVIFSAFFIIAGILFAEPVELTGGNLKLEVYPETGRFCLYHIADVGKNRYEPLLEDRNFGSTSWLSVQSNGRVFKITPRAGNTVETVKTANGIMLQFIISDEFYVEQEFSLTDPEGRGFPTALSMEIRVENTSGKTAQLAVKGLFDTMLGETSGLHFSTDSRKRISREQLIVPAADRDSILVSNSEQQSLVFYLRDRGVTVPSGLYIANWERLNTLTWLPEYIPGRSFNTLYSIQDSAALFVWPEKTIAPNSVYTVRMLFGPHKEKDYVQNTAARAAWEIQPEPKTEDERLAIIEKILSRIDEIELDPSIASDEELDYLNRTLDSLLQQRIPE